MHRGKKAAISAENDFDEETSGGTGGTRGVLGFLKETAVVLGIALVVSVILKTFLVQAFYIPSVSMENTLLVGDRLLVNKLKPNPMEIQRGDVVVFVDPGGWLRPSNLDPSFPEKLLTWVGLLPQNADEHLIKRIIGLPGDRVQCCDDQGRLMVNGVGIDEPYLRPGVVPSVKEFDKTVPANHLWMMGDNRNQSLDSRYTEGAIGGGFVPVRNVVGAAWVTIWPLDRLGVIGNYSETFDDVRAAK